MNILVTGISKGLGLNIAKVLLEKGYNVFGISRTKPEENIFNKFPENFKWLKFDLENSDDIYKTIFKEWITLSTPVHGFVNNAAIAYDDLITNVKPVQLEKMYQINVFSPIIFTKYVIRHMLLHNVKGSIVHISSVGVHTGYKGLALYASTKGALEAFSKNTSREWGEKGIRSNCVVAGFMETEMSSGLSKSQKERIYQRTSLKQAVEMESVSETVAFLLSNYSISVTGHNIFVDNGTF